MDDIRLTAVSDDELDTVVGGKLGDGITDALTVVLQFT